jgi:beta-glucosidase
MPHQLTFPPDFVWGVATSSYQIEGAWDEDGRSESIWDRFSHTPGKIKDGGTGDVACDHYHRWREDIALMQRLGIKSYRFSIAWPRILPDGRGRINQAGLDFYSRLVDGLLEAGIEPCATLYHWDLPQVLQDQGGWANRATAEAFVEYTEVVSKALGGRVKRWVTHNEPWCASYLSYALAEHAPGLRDWPAAILASHHLLLSHGWAVPVLRRNSPGSEVGITLNVSLTLPASPSPADYAAYRRHDGFMHRWFLDPLYGRHYPADLVAEYTRDGYLPEGLAFVQPGDLEAIAVPTDFLGINYYTRSVMRSHVPEHENLPHTVVRAPDEHWTEMGWEVAPESLTDELLQLHLTYRPGKIFITENGASYSDGPDSSGRVRDTRRLEYLRGHLAASQRAIQAGVPLAGYYAWSLLDNFEWSYGYLQRFGLVWVDYETQQRIPKDSALWYGEVIAANAVEL